VLLTSTDSESLYKGVVRCDLMAAHSLRPLGLTVSFLAGVLVMFAFQSLMRDKTPRGQQFAAFVNCQHYMKTRAETIVAPGAPEVDLPDQEDFEKKWAVAKASFKDNKEFWEEWYKKGITSWSGDPKLSPCIFSVFENKFDDR
jgi:hypothetical protein